MYLEGVQQACVALTPERRGRERIRMERPPAWGPHFFVFLKIHLSVRKRAQMYF